MDEREFWLEMRRGFLQLVDVIERKFGPSLRTSELRKRAKEERVSGWEDPLPRDTANIPCDATDSPAFAPLSLANGPDPTVFSV